MKENNQKASLVPPLSNHSYDHLKRVTTIVLPALATLYFALSQVWDFPKTEEVVATITAINTFLGLVLRASSRKYHEDEDRYDGNLTVVQNTEGDPPEFVLALNSDEAVNTIPKKDEVLFKVTVR